MSRSVVRKGSPLRTHERHQRLFAKPGITPRTWHGSANSPSTWSACRCHNPLQTAAGHVTSANGSKSMWCTEEDLQDVDVHNEKVTINEYLLGLAPRTRPGNDGSVQSELRAQREMRIARDTCKLNGSFEAAGQETAGTKLTFPACRRLCHQRSSRALRCELGTFHRVWVQG